jgi:tRNA threonylcarbamoyladenosine biosynthesis protein TsaB
MINQFILLIETSGENCSVAIANHQQVVASETELAGTSHVSRLTLMIANCLESAKLSPKDLVAVGVSDGPGSYTSLRVGASVAKGICFASSIPLLVVNTSKALARAALESSSASLIVPMIDARRMEVYCSIYDRELNLVSHPRNVIFDAQTAQANLTPYSLICGNGASKVYALLPRDTTVQLSTILTCDARFLVVEADHLYKQKAFSHLGSYNPSYFKAPNITTSKKNII